MTDIHQGDNLFMKIQQLSANIDQKMKQVDQQLQQLNRQLSQPNQDREQLTKDIATLNTIKHKLAKSQTIMWQAHDLQRNNDIKQLKRNRLIGISLLVFSGLGLIIIFLSIFLR